MCSLQKYILNSLYKNIYLYLSLMTVPYIVCLSPEHLRRPAHSNLCIMIVTGVDLHHRETQRRSRNAWPLTCFHVVVFFLLIFVLN